MPTWTAGACTGLSLAKSAPCSKDDQMSMSARETANDYVAEELRAELGRQRVSVSELARRMDVEQSWLHKRLTGIIPLRVGEVIEIAGLLKIPLERFFERVANVTAEGRMRKTLSSYIRPGLRLRGFSCAFLPLPAPSFA